MDVQCVDITTLTADPQNVRTHSGRNLEAVKTSLKRFGQRKPIVVGDNGVVQAGNATLEAARALGWDKIDIVRSPLDGPEARAYAIADNRTAELAEWDQDALAAALAELQSDGSIDHLVTGFTDDEIAELLGRVPEFTPAGEDDQSRLDRKDPVTCPECGHEFVP